MSDPLRPPLHSAWIEINLGQLRANFDLIHRDRPAHVAILSVVKDNAYGHGAIPAAQVALESGASSLAVSTLNEGLELREGGIAAPILVLGERQPEELEWCVAPSLTCALGNRANAEELSRAAVRLGRKARVHLKLDTGMSRYGVRWTQAVSFAQHVQALPGLEIEGIFSHFAMSDETDKTFARLQISRFEEALEALGRVGIAIPCRHLCNSGGLLDLPDAHYDMVRIGILPLGVYPSAVCRRIPGLAPVMTVKSRIACIQSLEPGDCVGYGMRYKAPSARRIAVIPVGYGDGFPRVRNEGFVLAGGRRAPVIGGVSMDALTVDITDIAEARLWDEVVLMGRQGGEEISVHEVAALKKSVSYDVLTGWRSRLPRVYSR